MPTYRSIADDAAIGVAQADVEWAKYLMDNAQGAYEIAKDDSSVSIREVGPVNATDLSTVIRGAGGAFITNASDPLVQTARGQWWKFSVDVSTDGVQARITENNYLLYGGLGIGGLILWMLLSNR